MLCYHSLVNGMCLSCFVIVFKLKVEGFVCLWVVVFFVGGLLLLFFVLFLYVCVFVCLLVG